MAKLKTLVFMDLEATGVSPYCFKNEVQITEISMIAIHINRFAEKSNRVRVLDKMTFCVCPRAMVTLTASEMSGLYNANLMDQSAFTSSKGLRIKHFLADLEQPVCLLAHNGAVFDFPLLKAELNRVDVTLPDYVYCMDTITVFQELLKDEICLKSAQIERDLMQVEPITLSQPPTSSHVPCREIDGYGPQTQEAVFKILEGHFQKSVADNKTPEKSSQHPAAWTPSPKVALKRDSNGKARPRRLYFGPRKFWPSKNKAGYGLSDLYKKVFDFKLDEEASHQAEADTMALLQISFFTPGFVDFVDYNCFKFATTKAMWN